MYITQGKTNMCIQIITPHIWLWGRCIFFNIKEHWFFFFNVNAMDPTQVVTFAQQYSYPLSRFPNLNNLFFFPKETLKIFFIFCVCFHVEVREQLAGVGLLFYVRLEITSGHQAWQQVSLTCWASLLTQQAHLKHIKLFKLTHDIFCFIGIFLREIYLELRFYTSDDMVQAENTSMLRHNF